MNEESGYKVTFNGQLASDMNIIEVKQNLSRLFNSSEETIDRMFSGHPMSIKKGLTKEKALSYQKAMLKAGAIANLVDMTAIEEIDLTAPPPISTEYDDDESALLPPPPAADTIAAGRLGIPPVNQWKIENVGVRMSKPKRNPIKPTISTDNIQLSPPKSEMGQAKHEKPVVNPDISHLDMDKSGARLSEKSAKESIPMPDVSHLDLAKAGEDMGQAIEMKELVEPDTSEYSLDDGQGNIKQLKHPVDLVNPDISNLNLVED
ncbi:MAG: hypothetical protein DRQ47_02565 [Gammaproteobacteria bacterium]|nr:MAG: hypothetical protein DRQ47_02565 [Gammaproteobacteria bacterium]